MKKRDIYEEIWQEADRVSREWFKNQCHQPYTAFYWYYLPGDIKFAVSHEKPGNNWELASSERISPGKSWLYVRADMCEKARRLPILSGE